MVINRLIFAINNVVNLVQKNGITPSSVGFIALSNLLQDFDTLEKRNEKFYELFTQIRMELENRKSEKQELIIVRINRMIDLGFENPSFSLDLLADSIGMSSAHMCRIYKQYTGNTINDLLVNKRMDKARQLLTSTTMSVNEIAEKVGYTNPTYFYRVFKKTNGVTPIEFRRK
jgi:YesN/AraC family two-component response regulator